MADPGVYLEKLSMFSRMLLLEGLAVSPQETADACELLTVLELEDREQIKMALRTVYAKSREEQMIFDRVFDGFFVSEETMRRQAQEQLRREAEIEQAKRKAAEELEARGQPIGLTEEQRETYALMPEEARRHLRDILDRYKDSAARSPKLYSTFIHSVFAKTIMEEQLRLEDAGTGVESLDPELGLLYRDISQFKDVEIPKAIAIIQSISRRINGELSAKRKRAGHTGKLDFRRTIRKGLETGGCFYRLRYKKKRQRKKHLVLLCDVSGSMVQFSEFALRFIQELNHVSNNSKVFLFSETLIEADPFSLQNMDVFRDYVRRSGIYGRGTDLGAALEKLCAMKPALLTGAATLLILSDSKTVNQSRAVEALREARRLSGQVVWLNPVPEGKWRYIKCIQTFASVCAMVSCSTLNALAAACRRLAEY